MKSLRKKSLENLFNKQPQFFENSEKYSSLYASHVFSVRTMEEYVNRDLLNEIENVIQKGNTIDRPLADQGSHRKYSCSNPNQKSLSSSSMVARPFETCADPSAFNTSVITKYPFLRSGSG